jgi:hypothetical protein
LPAKAASVMGDTGEADAGKNFPALGVLDDGRHPGTGGGIFFSRVVTHQPWNVLSSRIEYGSSTEWSRRDG